jgi:hypothetical protein
MYSTEIMEKEFLSYYGIQEIIQVQFSNRAFKIFLPFFHKVTKKCRLSWLTNSALYEPKCRGGGGGCGVSANEYSCAHGAQINFRDLTPHLTYGFLTLQSKIL